MKSNPQGDKRHAKRAWRGVIAPLAIPLKDPDRLDGKGLGRLVAHVQTAGVHGLFLFGTTGEGPALPGPLRRELIRQVCRRCADTMPIFVGLSGMPLGEALHLAEFAASEGAVAVVSTAPLYWPLTTAELVAFLERLSQNSPLPLLFYHIPACVPLRLERPAVRAIVTLPQMAGMKDSSPGMALGRLFLEEAAAAGRSDFAVFVGDEASLLKGLRMGAAGVIAGGVNLWPVLFVRLFQAVEAGDWRTARCIQRAIAQQGRALYGIGRSGLPSLPALKSALAWMGICHDPMAAPLQQLNARERERIGTIMARCGMKHGRLEALPERPVPRKPAGNGGRTRPG